MLDATYHDRAAASRGNSTLTIQLALFLPLLTLGPISYPYLPRTLTLGKVLIPLRPIRFLPTNHLLYYVT